MKLSLQSVYVHFNLAFDVIQSMLIFVSTFFFVLQTYLLPISASTHPGARLHLRTGLWPRILAHARLMRIQHGSGTSVTSARTVVEFHHGGAGASGCSHHQLVSVPLVLFVPLNFVFQLFGNDRDVYMIYENVFCIICEMIVLYPTYNLYWPHDPPFACIL